MAQIAAGINSSAASIARYPVSSVLQVKVVRAEAAR
jgi:hypothetical protein